MGVNGKYLVLEPPACLFFFAADYGEHICVISGSRLKYHR